MSMQKSPVNIGDVLKGQYEVKVMLGQGGFGAVFEVMDRKSKEQLALKVKFLNCCLFRNLVFLKKKTIFCR